MKISICLLLSLLLCSVLLAQISNIKQGSWSDHTIWNNNAEPVSTDAIILNFDIVVDVNSYCKSLTTNGHNVTVNTGVNLSIGSNGVIDTATLLKIININYLNGAPADSTLRVIKNAYANGRRRITTSQTDLPAGTDTFYTTFDYNNQNQLTLISDYSNIPGDDEYHENITWQNNKVIKIVSDDNGVPYKTDDFTYTLNGTNTNVSFKTTPPQTPDTTYSGNEIQYISSYKSYLTVNPQFVPVSQRSFAYNYYQRGPGSGIPGNHHDTTDLNYFFSANGNLSKTTSYKTEADTNVWVFPAISQSKDTFNYDFTRTVSEVPAVYELLKSVFGNDLLTLINFTNLDFGWAALLGDTPGNYNNYPFYKQTVKSVQYNAAFWMNGMPNPSITPIVDAITYSADTFFDNKNRLIRVVEYDLSAGNNIRSVLKIIYP